MQTSMVQTALIAMVMDNLVWLALIAASWMVTGAVLLRLRSIRRELMAAQLRTDVRRWIGGGDLRIVTADVLESQGLLRLMTPAMANDLYVSLEQSLGEALDMSGEYTEWDRLCDGDHLRTELPAWAKDKLKR